MTERIEQDIQRLELREPGADLDPRVESLFRVECPLSDLPLREPSEQLDARVAQLLADCRADASGAPAAAPAVAGRISPILRYALPLAACVAVGLTVFFVTRGVGDDPDALAVNPPEPSNVPHVEPVRYEKTVTGVEAGDVVILDDQLPVVPIRRTAVQQARWVDRADNNTEYELTVPREQMLIVPVQVD